MMLAMISISVRTKPWNTNLEYQNVKVENCHYVVGVSVRHYSTVVDFCLQLASKKLNPSLVIQCFHIKKIKFS